MFLNIEINFFAFLLSGVLAFLLGILWYHPKVMGNKWREVRGVDSTKLTPWPYVASFFCGC